MRQPIGVVFVLEIPVREESSSELVDAATFESMKRDGPKRLEGFELVFEGGRHRQDPRQL